MYYDVLLLARHWQVRLALLSSIIGLQKTAICLSLFKVASRATVPAEFEEAMARMKEESITFYDKVMEVSPPQWAASQFEKIAHGQGTSNPAGTTNYLVAVLVVESSSIVYRRYY